MEKIVHVHHPNLDSALLREVLKKFYWLREIDTFRKKPSTSELIDWIHGLLAGGVTKETLEKELPFAGVLLKKEQDLAVYQEAIAGGGRRHILSRRPGYF